MKNMYAVCTETFEFDARKYATTEEAYWGLADHDGKKIALCDSIEDAIGIIKGIEVNTTRFDHKLARATVAFIDESKYEMNEDGEWEFVDGRNYYEFKSEDL